MRKQITLVENMNQSNEPMPIGSLTFTLYPLDHVRAVLPSDWVTQPRKYDDQLERLESAIKQIKFVTECEFGHANYIQVDPDTDDFVQAHTVYQQVEQAARAAILKWGEELKRL